MHLRDLGALPFAHLLGFGRAALEDEGTRKGPPAPAPAAHLQAPPASKAAEEEKERKPDAEGEDDEDGADDEESEAPEKEKKPDAEGEGDEDDDAADEGPEKEKPAARIQAIVTSRHAVGSYAALGAFLAFSTGLSSSNAETVLQLAHAAADADGGKGRRRSLDERMNGAGPEANPQLGADAPPAPQGSAEATAAAILAAGRKARGEA
ncbi:hypothetical protein GXW78_07605 [Roseomonas terrae]|uniref:Uncharacterized protein n=1 Tax=Neoroseomonas terrae TaxID=424799 RepID=A0ABS5EEY1_9PROT|nr:hypothetical protein [Neoroseomonas terrae]MBR0649520.1 hypothetical protein [Neoroseomonas terrae]